MLEWAQISVSQPSLYLDITWETLWKYRFSWSGAGPKHWHLSETPK